MAKREISVWITARDQASRRFGAVERATQRLSRSLFNLKTMAIGAIGGIGIVRGMRALVMAASDAEEIGSKFATVFREEAAAADAFGERLAAAVGRSRTELRGFLATMQDTFVPLGFARDEARKMAQQVTKLAIDLASFNNVADADALRDLQSALVGNHETMRKYGVIITQGLLDQKLLAMGFQTVTKGATEQQKAMARVALIMGGTSDAQGDAVRTAGSFANQLRALKSGARALSEEIGDHLKPILAGWMQSLTGIAGGMQILIRQDLPWLMRQAKLLGTTLVAIWVAPRIAAGVRGLSALLAGLRVQLTGVAAAAGTAGIAMGALQAGLTLIAAGILYTTYQESKRKVQLAELQQAQKDYAATLRDVAAAEREYRDAAAQPVGAAGTTAQIAALRQVLEARQKIADASRQELEGMMKVSGYTRYAIDQAAQQYATLRAGIAGAGLELQRLEAIEARRAQREKQLAALPGVAQAKQQQEYLDKNRQLLDKLARIRAGYIKDELQREIRLIELRYEREVATAAKAGRDIALLEQAQAAEVDLVRRRYAERERKQRAAAIQKEVGGLRSALDALRGRRLEAREARFLQRGPTADPVVRKLADLNRAADRDGATQRQILGELRELNR
ncbi:MAG TPA: hypothetical protein VMW52_09500, partial [Phycisphaerae bacterium]|nr:hypothetical protein [Phycisphaerae bacterium]